jgi:hypothetical protein
MPVLACQAFDTDANPAAIADGRPMRKKSIIDSFSRAYSLASPDEQAALRVWMRDIFLPQRKPRKNLEMSRRCEKDAIAACDRRILEFPLEISPNAVAKNIASGVFVKRTSG